MTIVQMQRMLERVLRDLGDLQLEMHRRRFERDWLLLGNAEDAVGQVCAGFLDEAILEKLPFISSYWSRPEPAVTGVEQRCSDLFPREIPRGAEKVVTPKTAKRKKAA